VLFGKYVVVERLGEGGMGEVWLVRHRELDVERALKLIVAKVALDPDARARFRREARALARFAHPNAVVVHDADIRPDRGIAYIEMELIRGPSLDRLLKAAMPMPLDRTARLVDQLCDVLEAAHDQGIVHRDIKPTNLMLAEDPSSGHERLKVLDFGIAKILGADRNDQLTRTGLTVGTPAYMSPEQVRGEAGAVDGRSDLYSVGVLLYEMLTGRRPFMGTVLSITHDHLHTPPPPFAEANPGANVPRAVERVVMRCLEKDPARRPQTARELAEAFRAAGSAPAPDAKTVTFASRARMTPTGRRRVAAAAMLFAVAIFLTVVLNTATVALFWRSEHSVRLVPSSLQLRAGEARSVSLQVVQRGFLPTIRVTPLKVFPGGVKLAPESSSGSNANSTWTYRVTTDLNAARRSVTRLSFYVVGRDWKQTVHLPLTVVPPEMRLPPGFTPAFEVKLVPLDGGIFPERLWRTLPGASPVVFLLIRPTRKDDPPPFYVTQDKVWVGLYRRSILGRPDPGDQNSEGLRVPVMNVTAAEAESFARWLCDGNGYLGRLPTVPQWDKAAGLWDPAPLGRGPFRIPWRGGGVAVGLPAAVPVGESPQDVSPFGCRDMSGNGLEWTRPLDKSSPVALRGRRFDAGEPLSYDDLRDRKDLESHDPRQPSPAIGFRVVIELDPP
jgi:serine/threonine protein kinase